MRQTNKIGSVRTRLTTSLFLAILSIISINCDLAKAEILRQDDMPHGSGVYTYPDGRKTKQTFNMGQLLSEEEIVSQNSEKKPYTPPSGHRWQKAK